MSGVGRMEEGFSFDRPQHVQCRNGVRDSASTHITNTTRVQFKQIPMFCYDKLLTSTLVLEIREVNQFLGEHEQS